LNFDDPRSALFFTFVDILKHYKPKYFLLENVKMKKEYQKVISDLMGVEPIEINSALVSAQNRRRLYWTNIEGVDQPKDKGILLKDIIEDNLSGYSITQKLVDGFNNKKTAWKGKFNPHKEPYDRKGFCLTSRMAKCGSTDNYIQITGGAFRGRNPENSSDRTTGAPTEQRLEINETGKSNCLSTVAKDSLCIQIGTADIKGNESIKRIYSTQGKSPTLTAVCGGNQEPKTSIDNITWRKLTPLECERLQTFPDNYTAHVSNSRRYHALGNSWTVDVIAHILNFIPPDFI